MIWPRVPRSAISRAAAWPTLKQPVTLTSRCACHCACVTSRKGADSTMPAFPIAMSSGSIAASAASTAARSVTSTCTYAQDPVTDASVSGTRSSIVTCAPRLASSRAIAPPRSPAAPVTAMPRPARSLALLSVVIGRRRRSRVSAAPAAPRAFGLQGRPLCGFGRRLGAQLDGLAGPEHPPVVPGLSRVDQDHHSDGRPDDHDQRAVVECVPRAERMQRLDVLPEDPPERDGGEHRDDAVQPDVELGLPLPPVEEHRPDVAHAVDDDQ